MKQTIIINCTLAGLALVGLQGCAIQGADSFTPTGLTLNRSVRVGTDAFKPNPFEKQEEPQPQPVVPGVGSTTIINNNIYPERQQVVNPPVFHPTTSGPGLIVVETPPRPEDNQFDLWH